MLIEKPRIPVTDVLLYGLWPGFLKKLLYRLKGYKIGKGVSIGWGSVICGSNVTIGDHTSIGFLTIIRGRDVHIGRHVSIGSTTFLDTPCIEIGEGSKINEQVFVGGLQFPDSRFVLGRNCQVMQMSFINPAPSVVVGDDSGIGGHCLVFGHSSWQSKFEGYPVEFAPIEIGKSVSLSWRVFVLPGTKIGDGATVGANSLVYGSVPAKSLAIGFPARVVKRSPEFPSELTPAEKTTMFRDMITEMAGYFQASGLDCKWDGECFEIGKPASRWKRATGPWKMCVADGSDEDVTCPPHAGADIVLSLPEIPCHTRKLLEQRGCVWFDVTSKERSEKGNPLAEEVSLYLKRYGVRTLRCAPL